MQKLKELSLIIFGAIVIIAILITIPFCWGIIARWDEPAIYRNFLAGGPETREVNQAIMLTCNHVSNLVKIMAFVCAVYLGKQGIIIARFITRNK
jgi:hypothetical protein